MSSPIPEIDAEKLAYVIKEFEEYDARWRLAESQKILLEAAKVTLSTLPRWKEVEVGAFAVVDSDGEAVEVWLVEDNARLDADDMDGTVVRLTGTAKVRA